MKFQYLNWPILFEVAVQFLKFFARKHKMMQNEPESDEAFNRLCYDE